MSDLRIDRIPEKFRKDAVNFDGNGNKSLNDEELSYFCENMNITKDELMGLIVEHEKDILKEGVVKPAGYVIGGAAILSGAAFFAETVLTKGRSKGRITKAITGFFKKGVNVFKKGVKKAATNEMVPKINENSKNTAKTIAKATAGAGLVGAVATGITSCNVDQTEVHGGGITQNFTSYVNVDINFKKIADNILEALSTTNQTLQSLSDKFDKLISLLMTHINDTNRTLEQIKDEMLYIIELIKIGNDSRNQNNLELLSYLETIIKNQNEEHKLNQEQNKLLMQLITLTKVGNDMTAEQLEISKNIANNIYKLNENQINFATKVFEEFGKVENNQTAQNAILNAILSKLANIEDMNNTQMGYFDSILEELKSITSNTDAIKTMFNKIIALISENHKEIADKLQEILNKIPAGCDCSNVDLSQILDKLDKLLECCQANQNGGNCGNHEGILDDLEEMLS